MGQTPPPRRRPLRSSGRILRRTGQERPGQDASGAAAGGLPRPARSFALAAVLSGVFLVVATGAGITAGLPSMARDLGIADAQAVWIVNAYQIAMLTLLFPAAGVAKAAGASRTFLAGLALFALASAGCALAPDLLWLASCRALQGTGAACCMGQSMFLIEQILPRRLLGRGIGLNAAAISLAVIAGPCAVSAILAQGDWRLLFVLGMPCATASFALGLPFLPRSRPEDRKPLRQALPPDALLLGLACFGSFFAALSAASLGAFQLALAGAPLFLAAAFAYAKNQLRSPEPAFPADLLHKPAFSLSALCLLLCFMAQSACITACPFFFQERLGFTAPQTGLVLTAWPCLHVAASLCSARLAERFDGRSVSLCGMLICAGGVLSFLAPWGWSGPDFGLGTPVQACFGPVWRLALCGLGFGLFQAPNDAITLLCAPHGRRSSASAMLAMCRSLGQTLGAMAAGSAFASLPGAPEGAFVLAGAFALAGCLALALRRAC